MALKIRLRRMGRKKAPHYRIVIAESSMPRDGRFVATVGHYNPRTEPMTLVVDREKVLAWLAKGATPTDTVASLIKRAGVYNEAPAEGVVETVTKTAKKAAAAVTSAAQTVVETVTEAVSDAVEAVTGGEAEKAEEA
ncbi:MAG TPA: 30S ribosomal protein S16 [Gemmatimonadaceae bacterium]|nr:30S ribosomal protein S16 [Gemmatimonadaceae bacterium]